MPFMGVSKFSPMRLPEFGHPSVSLELIRCSLGLHDPLTISRGCYLSVVVVIGRGDSLLSILDVGSVHFERVKQHHCCKDAACLGMRAQI